MSEQTNQSSHELSEAEQSELSSLEESLAKFEGLKRWSDVIKTLIAMGELLKDPQKKLSAFRRAGELYIEKSSNQAEAIKCYQRILELDRADRDAIARLKQMYEKRRDFERLVEVMCIEIELLDEADRLPRYEEVAELASAKLRKPELCIPLWQKVLDHDPSSAKAIEALAQLYERARDWGPLVSVLEKQLAAISDENARVQALLKLGSLYGDKLNDDRGAVSAYERLLELRPNERRAQEQLKRRYAALRDWNALEAFYADLDKWDELIRVLEREGDTPTVEVPERIELYARVARLWSERKEKPDRAARSYEKILELDPDNVDAAIALSPIYEQGRDPAKLVAVYEVRLRHLEDPEERLVLLRETAIVCEERLKDPALAFAKYLEAFRLAPSREVTREDVERLASQVEGGWGQVTRGYEDAIEGATDPIEITELRLSAGQVLTQMGRTDDAIAQLAQVYDAEPDNMRAAQALEPLYRARGRFVEVLDIYRKRCDLEADPAERLKLAYDIARLQENELGQPEEAIESFRGIIAEYGHDELEAYRALEQLFEKLERYEDLAETLERRIDLGPSSDEELVALKFRLARVKQEHLGEVSAAVGLYREILLLVSEHEGAREQLEALLDHPSEGTAAAEILEPMYEGAGRWEELVRALEVLAAGAPAGEERLRYLTKVADVTAGPLGDPGRSFEVSLRALKEVPSDSATLERLEVLSLEHERFEELVKLLVELASESSEPDLSRTLNLKAAEHYATQLGNMEGAVECYNRILETDPGDEVVLGALETLYRARERYPELVGVLRRRVELAADAVQKEELLSQMAEVERRELGRPTEAIARYREILELDATNPRALRALGELYESEQLWSELSDNVSRELELASEPERQIELMLRLAHLREQRMDAASAAIDIYRDVLERQVDNAQAMSALERLMDTEEHDLVVADILEPLYREAGQVAKLIGVHEIQARRAGTVERRVQLLCTIAELYEEQLSDLTSAVGSYARALAEDPANEQTQAQLERVALAANETERLARVYEERVEAVDDPAIAAQLLVKAAQIRENMLGDQGAAKAHYRKVLALDPLHDEAASALERLYRDGAEQGELAEIYLVKARIAQGIDEQKAHLHAAAELYMGTLDHPDRAVEVYRQVLELDPEDVQSLDSLIAIFKRHGRWEELLATYTRRADNVSDPEDQKRIFAEMGAVYETQLEDLDQAIVCYQRCLEADPDDLHAIGQLDALYQRTQNWLELLSVLDREVELTDDPDQAIGFRFRIAELWDDHLDDAQRAVEGFREILDLVPNHEPSLAALEGMIARRREALLAAEVLDPAYRQLPDFGKLAAVQEVRIEHESDPIRKVELLHGMAELFEISLDDAAGAFRAYGRSLLLDPLNPTTQHALERLAEPLGAFAEVTRLYDEAAAKLREAGDGASVELALRSAQICEVQLDDDARAIERYGMVVDADPMHQEALEALDRLYETNERWEELSSVLQKRMEVAPTPDAMLHVKFRLGQLYERRLSRVEEAIREYADIIAAAPEHQPAVRALESLFASGQAPMKIGEILETLYRLQGAWSALIGVHEVQLSYQADPIERVAMMHRVAEIAEDRAEDRRLAFLWMQRALLEEPLNDHTDVEVERLAASTDGWGVLADTYAEVVSNGVSPEVKVTLGRRLARVYESELADVERAEESYRFVLGVDRHDAETLAALDRIYQEHHSYEALSEVLALRIEAAQSDYDRTELSFRRGQVLEHSLGRLDQAIEIYRRVLNELDPEHADALTALEGAYTSQADWPNLFATYEQALRVVVGDSAQSDIYLKMARLSAGPLEQPERAVQLYKEVLDLRGEDSEALGALAELYASQGNYRDLVDILERAVAVADSDDERIRIFSELGRVWYEKLDRVRSALESWERVLDLDPGHTPALFAIASIHRAAKDHDELIQTLHRIVDVGAATLEDAAIEQVYMELGELYDAREEASDAIDAYSHAVDVNPRNFAALDAMERIHTEREEWEERIAVRWRRVNALDSNEDKIAVLISIARSWADDLGRRSEGAGALGRVVDIDPMHEDAFSGLEALYYESEAWADLVELYLARVESVEGDPRIELLLRVARVYEEKLGDGQQAFDALTVAWSENYLHAGAAAELERVTGLIQAWPQLLTTANEALQQELPEEQRIAICLRCARWYALLERPDFAIPYYQQILQMDPGHVAAMGQMADLYRQTGQWDTVFSVLSRMLEVAQADHEKAEIHVQLGELCERQLGRLDQATSYYREALEFDGANLDALAALERMYREGGDWDELVDVLKRKASFRGPELSALAPDDLAVVLAAKLELSSVYRDHFRDLDRAIECLEEVIEVEGDNLAALRAIEPLYQQKERWQDLPKILGAQLEAVGTEKERIAILLRLSRLFEVEFVKPEQAAGYLEQVLDIDPNHLEALGGLTRIYRTLQRWDDVINTFERHAAATPDRGEKIEIYRALGDVYANELKDVGRAIDAYLNVTSLDEADAEALDALAKLYERGEDHASAIDALERLAEVVTEPARRVDLHYRIGRVLEEKLEERSASVEHYERAIDLDPGHLPSLEALRKIYLDNGDWLAAARMLEREISRQKAPRVLTRLNVELGEIYRDRLDEPERAILCFETAFKHDDTNEDAAAALVEHYLTEGRDADALPLLQLLVKTVGKRSDDDGLRLSCLLGAVAARLGDHALAVKAYGQAYSIDQGNLETIQGLAQAHLALSDWEKAGKFYQLLLMQHRERLSADEVVQAFHQLGVVKLAQGERRKALNMFDKALEQDPMHRATIARVIELHGEDGSWDQVIQCKKLLLEGAPLAERSSLLQEIAELWTSRLDNRAKAIEALEEAVALEPRNHTLLHTLLTLYQETRQWKEATEIIQRISDLTEKKQAKAKYAYTVGVILRDELKDVQAALARFNEALDLDPEQLKPFEAINKLLTQLKDWKNLERAFRKMLHRLMGQESPDRDLQFNLWHNLGVIYRDRLKQVESAAQAFKMASDLRPDDETEHQILGEIYAKLPKRTTEAVAEYAYLLSKDPYKIEHHQALYRLYFDNRDYDKAFCVARTLVYLKGAEQDQTQFYDQYKVASGEPSARLNAQHWIVDLYHPQQDKEASMVFRALCGPLFKSRYSGLNDKAVNLHKLKAVDLTRETSAFARAFALSMQVLSPDVQPRLFLRGDVPQGVTPVAAADPASICGSLLLRGHKPKELQFAAAHHLAYHRAEHYIRRMYPARQELLNVLLMALRSVGERPGDAGLDRAWEAIRPQMTAAQLEELAKACKLFLRAGARTDIKRWIQCVELTAVRAGFLVSNDLEASISMMPQCESAGPDDLAPSEKIKELILFSVSEEYFRLRQAIGISLRLA